MPVLVTVEFATQPGKGPTLAKALSNAIKFTASNPECAYANVGLDEDNPNHAVIQMVWSSSDAHKAYSAKVMADPKMAPVMAMMAGPPKTTYYNHVAHEA
jgi:quinol monooxygenase YgiN